MVAFEGGNVVTGLESGFPEVSEASPQDTDLAFTFCGAQESFLKK
jgi:hypothetical protein